MEPLDGRHPRSAVREAPEPAKAPGHDGSSDPVLHETARGMGVEPHPEQETPLGLTPRELQVLALVADGETNREIGRRLYTAEKTASVHVSRILAMLGVRGRTEAAAVAHRLGLAEGAQRGS